MINEFNSMYDHIVGQSAGIWSGQITLKQLIDGLAATCCKLGCS